MMSLMPWRISHQFTGQVVTNPDPLIHRPVCLNQETNLKS